MGHKIFVSYKYRDNQVAPLPDVAFTKARDYVTRFENRLDRTNHVYKGESDGESLNGLSEEQIWKKLCDRMYDSSVTAVFISPGMDDGTGERNQWIPWEISYSLKERTRNERTSHTNAVFSVVLPDAFGRYDYLIENKTGLDGRSYAVYHRNWLFPILRNNMFNRISNQDLVQNIPGVGSVHSGEPSYIFAVKWSDFIGDISGTIDRALRIRDDAESYDITKMVSEY